MKRFILCCALAALATLPAKAITMTIDVVDADTIAFSLSGALIGPLPHYDRGNLFVDAPVSGSHQGWFQSISGNLMLGANPLTAVYTGFNNVPYGGSLQIRNSINGTTPMSVGDLVSGTATVNFTGAHGLTQSMFDGAGVAIYWGHNGTIGALDYGTFQGKAVSAAPAGVPDRASTAGLLGLVVAGCAGLFRRMRNRAG